MSIGIPELIVALVLLGLIVVPLVVCALKGRWVLFALGFFFVVPSVVGAFLPAKPGSPWAQRRAG